MAISVFDLFSIGVGPSSSHTVGPMRAAHKFITRLERFHLLNKVGTLRIELFGCLGLTGKGHATDRALLLGLEGELPESVDPGLIEERVAAIRFKKQLNLGAKQMVPFDEAEHLIFNRNHSLPYHPNGMLFQAFSQSGEELASEEIYSIGGGFLVHGAEIDRPLEESMEGTHQVPYPFATGAEMLQMGRKSGLTVAEMMLVNEETWRSKAEVHRGLLRIWEVMYGCMERGFRQEGILPGGLRVRRRAAPLYKKLCERRAQGLSDPAEVMDWVSLYALAVNEENGAGGRVVTAPTNGAAGIIPAVLRYYLDFTENPTEQGIYTYLLTAGAIGILYKRGASISAAEVGCQGEVGVACSMAAGALSAALGGSNAMVEHAAEIGMEHNLGLTCDPVGGLVQIPCIERNTMGALKAINAQRLAVQSFDDHRVTLDQVIATMRQTGKDMRSQYKETSQGGLALNVIAC